MHHQGHYAQSERPSQKHGRVIGPTSGRVGVEYTYTFVATDPEGDNVSYCIDWGIVLPSMVLVILPYSRKIGKN
jgi:hypothetical protein